MGSHLSSRTNRTNPSQHLQLHPRLPATALQGLVPVCLHMVTAILHGEPSHGQDPSIEKCEFWFNEISDETR